MSKRGVLDSNYGVSCWGMLGFFGCSFSQNLFGSPSADLLDLQTTWVPSDALPVTQSSRQTPWFKEWPLWRKGRSHRPRSARRREDRSSTPSHFSTEAHTRACAVFSSVGKSQAAWHQALGTGSQRFTVSWQCQLPSTWRTRSLCDVATFLTREREPWVSGEAALKYSLVQEKGYH